MKEINVTEFRNHLPKYLSYVKKGDEIVLISRGNVIAVLIPPKDLKNRALSELKKLRKKAKIIDVVSPINEKWDAEK